MAKFDTEKDLLDTIKIEEGWGGTPYKDSVGKWTWGYGLNIQDRVFSIDEKLTLFNFISALPDEQKKALASWFIERIVEECKYVLQANLPWVTSIHPTAYNILKDLCYNMGWGTLSTFRITLGHFQEKNYKAASAALQDSLWYKQVGERAKNICSILENL